MCCNCQLAWLAFDCCYRSHYARGPLRVPASGDVVLINDGGQRFLHKDLLAPFQEKVNRAFAMPACQRVVTLGINADSINARKKRRRGELSQVQQLLCVTARPLLEMIPEKGHSQYPGTIAGDMMAWVVLTPPHELWELEVEKKREIYGDKMVQTGSVDKDPRSARPPLSMEPVRFSFMPESFYQNVLQAYSCIGVVDLTSGPGMLARACLSLRRPYLGVCYTEAHCDALMRHLVQWVLQCMAKEGHSLYNAKYVEAKKAEDKHKDETTGKDGDSKKAKKTVDEKPKK